MRTLSFSKRVSRVACGAGLVLGLVCQAHAADYLLRPGDVLQVSVWHETELNAEVLVRPRFHPPAGN